jgi:hypothetical protein
VSPARLDALTSAVEAALRHTGNGALADRDCLEAGVGALPESAQEALDLLIDEPSRFEQINHELARVLALAYVGCIDQDVLVTVLALMTTSSVEHLPCVTDGWMEIIDADAVASSLAYGNGLDDLADDTVAAMTLVAGSCIPEQAWIDDESAALALAGFSAEQAACAATAIADTFGVGPIIRRRVLWLDLLPIPQAELAAAGLPERCGTQLPAPASLDATPGTCLTGFGHGTESTRAIECSEAHNAEVVSVIDLAAESTTWPGSQTLRETAVSTCTAAVERLGANPDLWIAGWDFPLRTRWEFAQRELTCVLLRSDAASWTGPSGVVPAVEDTTQGGPPPTTSGG